MNIPLVSTYLRQRTQGSASSAIIHALELAAAEAADRGDTTAAAALQREADRLRQDMRAGNLTFARKPANAGKEKPLDQKMLAIEWAGLTPDTIHASTGACLLDCGPRGVASVTTKGVFVTGALTDDPTAILLLARHAQLNWNAKAVMRGSPEFQFKFAVAARMLGVKVPRGSIPRERRAEAAQLARDWQPVLERAIYGNTPSPKRPPDPAREAEPEKFKPK